MAGKLVNAFGAISLEATQTSNQELLLAILVEMRIMNEHLARMREDPIDAEDLDLEDFTL